jgi:hypothetical protein
MKTFIILFLTAALAWVAAGCEGWDFPSNPPPSKFTLGPVPREPATSVYGYVSLIDINGDTLKGASGVTVSIDGGYKITHTDSSGRWALGNFVSGEVGFTWVKPGYAEQSATYEAPYGMNTNYGDVPMYALPQFTIAAMNVSVTSGVAFSTLTLKVMETLAGTVPSAGAATQVFAYTDNTVSADPAHYLASFATAGSTGSAVDFSEAINLYSYGMQSGQKIYFAAYPECRAPVSYIDPRTGRNVYTGLGATPSNVVAITLP